MADHIPIEVYLFEPQDAICYSAFTAISSDQSPYIGEQVKETLNNARAPWPTVTSNEIPSDATIKANKHCTNRPAPRDFIAPRLDAAGC
jgi:hypothetical protein